ncbi:MAG: hypothetical protein RR481_01315 [Longicatena sp.]
MNIRLDEDTARYIELASSYHGCTKTDFITKQVVRPEFLEIKFDDVKPLLNMMSNVASNLNQIARAMNIIKAEGNKMTDEEFEIIKEDYKKVKQAFGEHDDEMRKCLLGFYKIIKNKKIRPIGEEISEEFSNITGDGENEDE